MTMPLAGVRVADFTWVGAGAFATRLLADHGADVIKVESSAKIDGIRLSGPFKDGIPGVNRSGYFADRNADKRSISLNLKTAEGVELARRLIAGSDIVANNFSPGVMERLGLGYEEVRAANPGVIYLAMSMQGSSGPDRDQIGYGQTIAATVGLQHLTGDPSRVPIGTGTNYPDHVPNPTHAAIAVLAALRHRRRTGEGQFIDLAQTEPSIAVLGDSILEATATGTDVGRTGNTHRRFAPHGVYSCAGDDEWIAIAVTEDWQWPALVSVLGLDVPAEWSAEAARKADEKRVDEVIARAVAQHRSRPLAEDLRAEGVPASRVNDARDALDDPQLQHREHWVRLRHPEIGDTVYGAPPFRLSRTPGQLRMPAPCLGEHTREVGRTVLGLSDEELDRLKERGVLS